MTGKGKLCEKMKKSLNILSKIVWRLSFYFLILWKYMQTLNLPGVGRRRWWALHKDCLFAIWRSYCTKFVRKAKIKNRIFWSMWHLGACNNSGALKIRFNSKRGFQNSKIWITFIIQGVSAGTELKTCFLRQSWTKYCKQILEIR